MTSGRRDGWVRLTSRKEKKKKKKERSRERERDEAGENNPLFNSFFFIIILFYLFFCERVSVIVKASERGRNGLMIYVESVYGSDMSSFLKLFSL